jgi:hypothetical protein
MAPYVQSSAPMAIASQYCRQSVAMAVGPGASMRSLSLCPLSLSALSLSLPSLAPFTLSLHPDLRPLSISLPLSLSFSHTHSLALVGPQVWHFKQPYRDAITSTMRFREQQRGYIDSLYAAASATGLPVIRPLAVEFPDDPHCLEVDDQVTTVVNGCSQ